MPPLRIPAGTPLTCTPRDLYARRSSVPWEGVKALAHRKPIIQYATELSALALIECRHEALSPRMERLQTANLLMGEFAEMADRITRSMHDHGEVTERCYRYLRENLRDLTVNVLGRTDVPSLAGESAMTAAD
jgi:hypothetical protein